MNTPAKTIDDLNFEDAMQELETIVKSMETGEAKLADSIQYYERGVALKKHCQKLLQDAQSKIETIQIQDDGSTKTEPFAEN